MASPSEITPPDSRFDHETDQLARMRRVGRGSSLVAEGAEAEGAVARPPTAREMRGRPRDHEPGRRDSGTYEEGAGPGARAVMLWASEIAQASSAASSASASASAELSHETAAVWAAA